MKTTERFDNAIHKLYEAFNNKKLNPEDCKYCAVGTILNHTDSWQYLTDKHGSQSLNYVGMIHQNMGRRFNGYTPLELLNIEATFLKGCGYYFNKTHHLIRPNTPLLFDGFYEVVKLLCKFEGLNDLIDYTELFKEYQSEVVLSN